MGQKVHPIGFRVGVTKSWKSERFPTKKSDTKYFFLTDTSIRSDIEEFYGRAGISKIVLRLSHDTCEGILFVAKPGVILGKDGEKLQQMVDMLKKKYNITCSFALKQLKIPEYSANIMAEQIVDQLEKRMPYRRVVKSTIQRVREKNVQGVKIKISGRLNGSDMTRKESFIEGRISLQKLRADIDYAYITAHTKYGILGVKVWIYINDIYT